MQLQFYGRGSWRLNPKKFAHILNLPRETVTSLTLTSTSHQLPSRAVLIFICSFPNLKYLRVGLGVGNINREDVRVVETSQILNKHKLTGTLVYESIEDFTQSSSPKSRPFLAFGKSYRGSPQ